MSVKIREIGIDFLPCYAEIPESFLVESIFYVELINKGLGGFRFIEKKVTPYTKWGEQRNNDSGPLSWQKHFDINNGGFL